ncbi:MAG: arylsulfatase [Candidatus Nealsonbacteria bacterium]|nr:arylsulfatase [Candidatus Nealsonbacteria bacterium]
MVKRRTWHCPSLVHCLLAGALVAGATHAADPTPADLRGPLGRQPNVILVMTDDQGYGDLGCHGNDLIKTPALDMLYKESIRLTNFHVDPTCSPTRAALLTGRYSCRTGVWHTLMGRSLLRRDERTVADLFAAAGYRTAIFGKWHLGDNYPYRAIDRGFHESLVHGGGGIGQVPDYWGNTYFKPVLCRNGTWVKSDGYCTDVFFDAAIRFISDTASNNANRSRPFLLYLPTNVPHEPYQVAEKYSAPYEKAGASKALAAFYGMITNFDENMARLLSRLDELKLADNTIFIFMTDNGTSGRGFNVEMRGRKGSAYDGGHRVPCFIRWPAKLTGDFDVAQLTAHVDLLPTLLELCEVPKPKELKLDGKSLLPLLVKVEDWATRTLFVQSHRIENPQPWRQSAVMAERYRVVVRPGEYGVRDEYRLVDGRELFDVKKDPEQLLNKAPDNPKLVAALRFEYEEWYKDVSKRFGETSDIVIGSPKQNPTVLNSFDWHSPDSLRAWHQRQIVGRPLANGFWAVEVEQPGRYRITLRERPAAAKYPLKPIAARIKIGNLLRTGAVKSGATAAAFEVELPRGSTRLQTWLAEPGGVLRGAYYTEVEYLGPVKPLKDDPAQKKPAEDAPKKPSRPGAYGPRS